LNRSVWEVQEFVRAEREWDEELWRQRYQSYLECLFGLERLIRADLQIPGEVLHPPRPPDWFFSKRA
jgi:hypothetical protein